MSEGPAPESGVGPSVVTPIAPVREVGGTSRQDGLPHGRFAVTWLG